MNQQPDVIRININTCLNEEREENNIKACEANAISLIMKRKLKRNQLSNVKKIILTLCMFLLYILCVSASKLLDEIKEVVCLAGIFDLED